jgi:polygalacturonase
MFRTCLIGLTLSAFACPAGAYYVAWEGDCLPEEAGWTRNWGDWSGCYHGTGAGTLDGGDGARHWFEDESGLQVAVERNVFKQLWMVTPGGAYETHNSQPEIR